MCTRRWLRKAGWNEIDMGNMLKWQKRCLTWKVNLEKEQHSYWKGQNPNNVSKIRAKCMEEIRCKPGILKSELYNMNIGHERSIYIQVDQLIYEGSVVRAWDKITRSYRFYPKGQEPPIHELKVYKKSLYSRYTGIAIPNDVHGEKFMMVFDEAFGILYIDLKILGMAAQQLGEQKK